MAAQTQRVGGSASINRQEINRLLAREPGERSVDERIRLFHFVLRANLREAEGARGKDVVCLFGDTGVGKSVFSNWLSGLPMREVNGGIGVRPPASPVTPIGTGTGSCTLVLREVLSVPFRNKKLQRCRFPIYDLSGFHDTRGPELTLPNRLAVKKIIEVARSIRFVIVSEHSHFTAVNGRLWKQTLGLFQTTFPGVLKKGSSSVCLLVTKHGRVSIQKIKEEIKKNTPPSLHYLADRAMVYNPLGNEQQKKLSHIYYSTDFCQGANGQVSISTETFKDVWRFSKQVKSDIKDDLKNGDKEHLAAALRKVQFIHQIMSFGNKDLQKLYKQINKCIQNHAQTLSNSIQSRVMGKENVEVTPEVMEAFERYKLFQELFGGHVNLSKENQELNEAVKGYQDPRYISWEKPTYSIRMGGITSIATTALAFLGFSPLAVLTFAAAGGGVTLHGAWNYFYPSKKDQKIAAFLEGVQSTPQMQDDDVPAAAGDQVPAAAVGLGS